jgi:hypothetical protein
MSVNWQHQQEPRKTCTIGPQFRKLGDLYCGEDDIRNNHRFKNEDQTVVDSREM